MSTKVSHRRAVRNLMDVLPIAKRDVDTNEYLHGFSNGLEMAKNCITGKMPDFVAHIGRYKENKFRRGNPK